MKPANFALMAVLCISPTLSRAEQDWKKQNGPQAVFTAAIWTDNYARLVVECRSPAFLAPELAITLVPPSGGIEVNTAEIVATFTAGNETASVPMVKVGEGAAGSAYRWTGVGAKGVALLRKVSAEATPGPLTVTLPGWSPISFKSSYNSLQAMEDVVIRCMPSVVRARRTAGEMTNIKALITLSDDANDKCRGGGVEDVMMACSERSEYSERLHALGICYGKSGEAGYQMQWHRCGSTSIR